MSEQAPTAQQIAEETIQQYDVSGSRREAFEPKGLLKKVDQEAAGQALAADETEARLVNQVVDSQMELNTVPEKISEAEQAGEEAGRIALLGEQREAGKQQEEQEKSELEKAVDGLEKVVDRKIVEATKSGKSESRENQGPARDVM